MYNEQAKSIKSLGFDKLIFAKTIKNGNSPLKVVDVSISLLVNLSQYSKIAQKSFSRFCFFYTSYYATLIFFPIKYYNDRKRCLYKKQFIQNKNFMKSLSKVTFFSKPVLGIQWAKPVVVKLPSFRLKLYAYDKGSKPSLPEDQNI